MSFTDHVILWLHIAAVIFTIGPGTAAMMSTPRYIRKRNIAVVGYLYRITRIYAAGTLLVLVFGLIMAQLAHDFSRPWISVSITLYVVAAVLLVLVLRDQRRALSALQAVEEAGVTAIRSENQEPEAGGEVAVGGDEPAATITAIAAEQAARTAAVERGRIASMSGIVALIWLAILVLMVWNH
jgi:Ca2+/Na+ antiporter